ncbi:hypothetical protein DBR42_06665 [Pelomonas sp. HMWF004]|nr:hypothetical protein DBR42_06665 [Pelomonas sp. HMWF004]
MHHAKEGNSLFERAKAVARNKFDADTSGRNFDKVCAVALKIDSPEESHALFSGAPGYAELTDVVAQGGDKRKAQQTITAKITAFLRSESGGSFTNSQITNAAYDRHGRGAMNCAEPKLYYLLGQHENLTLRNWVLVPFNLRADDGALIYNAPCKNCRRWVYQHFHPMSGLLALAQQGPEAFEG